MIHLQELGLSTSDGSMCFEWNESDADNMVVTSPDADTNYDYYHETYTLQDILDKLPTLIIISSDFYKICIESSCGYWDIYYYKSDATELISKKSENIIDVAYDMLCWCIENGYVEKEGK
ncbi:hypothetical protein [Bacteroides stercoris]|uniref:hypothetical protein n=1 Tax=Bacteroides stercoris TaxID=46506 RepID=UPI00216ADD58|nr:hypothetical protein [Bacteroides stercoris]